MPNITVGPVINWIAGRFSETHNISAVAKVFGTWSAAVMNNSTSIVGEEGFGFFSNGIPCL